MAAVPLRPSSVGRRDILRVAGAAFAAPALPAFANYVDGSGSAPKLSGAAYIEATQAARNYKFEKPLYEAGTGSDAFVAAEKKRKAKECAEERKHRSAHAENRRQYQTLPRPFSSPQVNYLKGDFQALLWELLILMSAAGVESPLSGQCWTAVQGKEYDSLASS